MRDVARALKKYFGPRLSPLQLAMERDRIEREEAELEAEAQAAAMAARQLEFDEWLEEQRQLQLDQQTAAIENRSRHYSSAATLGAFQLAAKVVTRRPDAPAPRKSRRKRGGEDRERAAFVRKHMRRLFRKMARDAGEDWRDAPRSIDNDWWHRHHQSFAAPDYHADCGFHSGPNHPSPTL